MICPLLFLLPRTLCRKYEELYSNRDDVIIIRSDDPRDEMRRQVVDQLVKHKEKYRRVLESKGFAASETENLLALITSWFIQQSRG